MKGCIHGGEVLEGFGVTKSLDGAVVGNHDDCGAGEGEIGGEGGKVGAGIHGYEHVPFVQSGQENIFHYKIAGGTDSSHEIVWFFFSLASLIGCKDGVVFKLAGESEGMAACIRDGEFCTVCLFLD